LGLANLVAQSSKSISTVLNPSITLQKRGGLASSGAIALNKIGETLEGLTNFLATQTIQQAELHAQLASKAITLICDHEAILSKEEMVAIFEVFNKNPVQAISYLTMPKKEYGQFWVENWLVELGICDP